MHLFLGGKKDCQSNVTQTDGLSSDMGVPSHTGPPTGLCK